MSARGVEAELIATSREITVNTHAQGGQHDPSVAVAPGDGFVVVWEDNRFDNEGTHIRARKLGVDLEPVADDVQIDGAKVSWVNHVTKPISLKVTFTGEIEGNSMSGKAKIGFMGTYPFTAIKE
mgnify:CR=1 FL=1